jgi:hypothetical protein
MAGPAALACSIPLVVQNVTACGTLGLNTARGILDSWKVGRRVVHALVRGSRQCQIRFDWAIIAVILRSSADGLLCSDTAQPSCKALLDFLSNRERVDEPASLSAQSRSFLATGSSRLKSLALRSCRSETPLLGGFRLRPPRTSWGHRAW